MGSKLELLDSRLPDKLFLGMFGVVVEECDEEEGGKELDGNSRFIEDEEDERDGKGSGSVDGFVIAEGDERE